MFEQSWDPLLKSQQAESEIVSAAQKREIRNILKSYVGMYDPFSELIQNAMDAVDRRAAASPDPNYKRRLWLTIDLRENSFCVVDNGVGFNEKELLSFLAPNISFKGGESTRGNKGVGATYVGYGFDYLLFGTKANGFKFLGELLGGRDWVDDDQGVKTRPVVAPCSFTGQHFENIDRGSIFKLKFGGKSTRPKDLSWYGATSAGQWLYLLLIKTPLGAIDRRDDPRSRIEFNLRVINKAGTEDVLTGQEAAYIFPHQKIHASVDLADVLALQQKLIKEKKDASAIPGRYLKSNGIYEFYSNDAVRTLRNDEHYEELVSQYEIRAYGYFTYSTSVWDQLNDDVAKLRKGYRVLRGGLQLANNDMIQGELITIPLTSNIGYQNQCHIVVHFRNADPDLGRKGFQPELKEVAESISVAIVNRLKQWKKLLKADTGVKPDIEKELELHEWVRDQEKHEELHPLSITSPNFFIPINEISITSEPQSEQDVIVLFNQLIAGGIIRGIRLLATSQVKQYDGVYRFVVREPLENHIFDEQTNPLGVDKYRFSKSHTSPPKVLEYKFSLDALIHEFENGDKFEKDVHLSVTWEMGTEWRRNYSIISYLDLNSRHQRDYHGLTHALDSGTTRFYVIALKELISYLNDIQGVQKYQRDTYGDAIT